MHRIFPIFVLLFAACTVSSAAAQTMTGEQSRATQIGRGWTAIGAGQTARAIEIARQLLRDDPANHDALALAIAAFSTNRQPLQGLDTYETWLKTSRNEDVYLLQPIARALLRELIDSRDSRIRLKALLALADAGDTDARNQIRTLAGDPSLPADVDAALAAGGDRAALARLEADIASGGRSDKSAPINAMLNAGLPISTKALAAALKDSAPPSRIAAANALGDLQARDSIPALKEALQEPDPAVRNIIAVALARLGDTSGGVTVESLENSPLGEFRLLAAKSAARENPQGAWADKVRPILSDPDPLVRLRAARLLLDYQRDEEAATAALATALTDQSPAVRTEAAGVLRHVSRLARGVRDIGALRRLLRDPVPDARIEAAGAILGKRE